MFCIWLKKSRRELGLTQRALGRETGLNPSTLGMYEQGRRRPSPKAKARLRMFFSRTEIGSACGISLPAGALECHRSPHSQSGRRGSAFCRSCD